MGILDIFKKALIATRTKAGSKSASSEKPMLDLQFTASGVTLEFMRPLATADLASLQDALESANAQDSVLGAYLVQLATDGHANLTKETLTVPWSKVYELLSSAEHAGTVEWLALPPPSPLRPLLTCEGTLSESNFRLDVTGWTDTTTKVTPDKIEGGIAQVHGRPQLLSRKAWETYQAINEFNSRPEGERNQHEQELSWGRIRKMADEAGAMYLSPYLETTFVLTPENLRLPLEKEETPFGRVYTVAPTFEGAPSGFLAAFDGYNSVQPHYELTRGGGRVRVVISEPVRQVLSVIKREMPGRKVSGSRAEKFIHNPWAFLGDAAHEVLDQKDFEQDRAAVMASAAIFSLLPQYKESRVESVDLSITVHYSDGSVQADRQSLESPDALRRFLASLRTALEDEREWFAWKEFDLTLDGESSSQLELGQQLAHLWENQPDERVSLDDIYALEEYSGRIEGIGAARPVYVPVLQGKKSDEGEDGWTPEDLTPMVAVTLQGHAGQVLIPLTRQWVDDFEKQVAKAEQSNEPVLTNPVFPSPIGTHQARTLVESFKSMFAAQDHVKTDKAPGEKLKKGVRQTLLMKTNFHAVDYAEARKASLTLPAGALVELPSSLRPDISLKKHQLYGITWFQHLVSKAPFECRGALLADDMGLGKTVQLLCVLGQYYEQNPTAAPSVIFAPKSLLENWYNETRKFFTPSFPKTLVLYEEELKVRRQPLGLIDSQLQQKGIVDLLKPGWVGGAKVIFSTYDVLTSYEFSFAKQPFTFIICDEAQRIKNPGTLVAMAVKKLKADFRVACTGTPVENSLADLWCLFDFVQPGLLGSLEEFGKTYRRPIECQTEEQKAALDLLQETIAPQTLRRTKADIAADLPKKFFAHKAVNETVLRFKEQLEDSERLELPLTQHQLILYKAGLKKLQDAAQERNGRKRAQLSFGALHHMKAVCAEPYCLPGSKFLVDSAGSDVHLANSPKMKWLIEHLHRVKEAKEKAIVFTEHREAQAALSYFLKQTFGIRPFVINGDTQKRQAFIDKFSASEGFDVIILSTLAAGAGLNVTAANHVFHFTRAWNPAKEAQATDRAYRIGAPKDVFVYCPTVVANDFKTFEVRLDELLKKKSALAGATLDDGGLNAMLNGTGADATFAELVGEGGPGESLPQRHLTIDDIDRMDGFAFEVFCCVLWSKRGYQTSLTQKKGGDGGIDVIALQGKTGELLQCKSSVNTEVGWDAIKEVTTGAARYQARFAGTRLRRIAVTNQRFSSGAAEHANANQVELVTRRQLLDYIVEHPVTNLEFDDALVHWKFSE
ncbi:MAG: restriction endonuclease [Burkholderiales bacterium]|nr:restriction endonuclease [Rhodocyclaceae bacterium]MCA3174910.1 restriction endonuclease [Burkholderiales bacterium]